MIIINYMCSRNCKSARRFIVECQMKTESGSACCHSADSDEEGERKLTESLYKILVCRIIDVMIKT